MSSVLNRKRPISMMTYNNNNNNESSNSLLISSSTSSTSKKTSTKMMILFVLYVLSTSASSSDAFQSITMKYSPPVKTSVRKFHDARFLSRGEGVSSSSSSMVGGRSSPSSSSHGGFRDVAGVRRGTGSSSSASSSTRMSSASPPRYSPSSSSRSAHAATYAAEALVSTGLSSFERRMRELVMGSQRQGLATTSSPSTSASAATLTAPRTRVSPQEQLKQKVPSYVQVIESLQDYKTFVGDEDEKLVVVRFHATWCKACQSVTPMYHKLAWKHSSQDSSKNNVVFVDVPVTNNNANLHQGLGVPSLPFAHIYHPELGLVEESKLTRKHIQKFGKTVQNYLQGYCTIDDDDSCKEE